MADFGIYREYGELKKYRLKGDQCDEKIRSTFHSGDEKQTGC